jgi:GTPase SAR1 family protein
MLSKSEELRKLIEDSSALLSEQAHARILQLFEEKMRSPLLKILVYGPYNSGKTLLTNALAGKEIFSSAPLPETSELQSVRFEEFEIVDSPGLDAPDPHAEMLSRKAANWDADLVLFVVSSAGHHESGRVKQEIKGLLESGRSLLFVVNEIERLKDEDRLSIKNSLQSCAIEASNRNENARFYGPVFVNALSAFRARTSSPVKRKLEEESGILELESAIHSWILSLGKYAPLATVSASLLQELKKCREEMEKKHTPLDSKWATLAKEIDRIQNEIEDLVASETNTRVQNFSAWAEDFVYSQTEVNESVFLSEIESTCQGLQNRVIEALELRLARICDEYELGNLAGHLRLPAWQGFGETQTLEQEPNHSAVDSVIPAPVEKVETSVDQPFPRTLKALTITQTLKEAGMFKTLRPLGKVGKIVSKVGKALPWIALGLDIVLAVRDWWQLEKRKKQAQKELQAQIEEMNRIEEARKRALVAQIRRLGSDFIKTVGNGVLLASYQVLRERRKVFEQKMQEEQQLEKSFQMQLEALDDSIARAQELLLDLSQGHLVQ